MLMKMDRTN